MQVIPKKHILLYENNITILENIHSIQFSRQITVSIIMDIESEKKSSFKQI